MLRPDVERYGPDVVWSVGCQEMGYPPTWIDSGGEVVALREALKRRK